jgi:penicillin-binding protein 1A
LVSGVWVGGDDRSIHFRSSSLGEGSKTALPVYVLFMEKVYADKNLGITMGKFPKPDVPIKKKYNCPTPWVAVKKDSTATDSLDGNTPDDFIGPPLPDSTLFR